MITSILEVLLFIGVEFNRYLLVLSFKEAEEKGIGENEAICINKYFPLFF